MVPDPLLERHLTGSVIGAFYEVYRVLGFGFLESIYEAALESELRTRGHAVARQQGIMVMYKGLEVGRQRMDMVVDAKVVIEIKSTAALHQGAKRQVYNYLKATGIEVGLLLHFGPRPRFYRVICRNRTLTSR